MDFRKVVEIAKKGDMIIFTYNGKRTIDYVDSRAFGLYRTKWSGGSSWSEKVAEFGCEYVHHSWYELVRIYFPINSKTRPIDEKDVDYIALIPKASVRWIDKAYEFANLNSNDDDCIWKAIYKYKRLRELNEEQQQLVYELLVERLGYKTA